MRYQFRTMKSFGVELNKTKDNYNQKRIGT
jgi:hypothetical protein